MKQKDNPRTLSALSDRQAELRAEIRASEARLRADWHALTAPSPAPSRRSPVRRAIAFAVGSAGVLDGAILGWKLYRRLKR